MRSPALGEYQAIITSWLRSLEHKLAKGDQAKLQNSAQLTDEELLRKWLWVVSIIGGPACFLGVPIILSLLGTFMPRIVMVVLWFLAKGAMGIVFILFILAIVITTRKGDQDDS
ncbi:MAG TPA: hypothetical protein V6C72_20215 [Chroococcales cyanobacterium]